MTQHVPALPPQGCCSACPCRSAYMREDSSTLICRSFIWCMCLRGSRFRHQYCDAPSAACRLSFSVPGMLNLLVLTATTSAALGCYFTCMFTDPGRWAASATTQRAFAVFNDCNSGPLNHWQCSTLRQRVRITLTAAGTFLRLHDT